MWLIEKAGSFTTRFKTGLTAWLKQIHHPRLSYHAQLVQLCIDHAWLFVLEPLFLGAPYSNYTNGWTISKEPDRQTVKTDRCSDPSFGERLETRRDLESSSLWNTLEDWRMIISKHSWWSPRIGVGITVRVNMTNNTSLHFRKLAFTRQLLARENLLRLSVVWIQVCAFIHLCPNSLNKWHIGSKSSPHSRCNDMHNA